MNNKIDEINKAIKNGEFLNYISILPEYNEEQKIIVNSINLKTFYELIKNKHYSKADEQIAKIISENPNDYANYHKRFGLYLNYIGKEKAINYLKEISKYFGDDPLYVYDLCKVSALYNSNKALEFLEKNKSIFDNDEFLYMKTKAMLLDNNNLFEESGKVYRQLYEKYKDRESAIFLIPSLIRKNNYVEIESITSEIIKTKYKDKIYYLCAFYNAFSAEMNKSDYLEKYDFFCNEYDKISNSDYKVLFAPFAVISYSKINNKDKVQEYKELLKKQNEISADDFNDLSDISKMIMEKFLSEKI